MGFFGVFLGDDVADFGFNGFAGEVFAAEVGDGGVEEVFEFEDSAGCVDVFVGGDAADGGFGAFDVVGEVA